MGDQFELENGDAVTLFSTAVVNQIVTVEGAVFGKQFNKTGSVAVPREPGGGVDIAFSPGMSLLSVLDEVGGPTPYFSQSEESYLIRTLRDGSVERTELKIQDLWDTRDTSMDINLLPGDFILVPMQDMNVFLTGQVRKPGAYGFITGYTVDDYILLAGGINEDTADVNTIFFKDERGGKRER